MNDEPSQGVTEAERLAVSDLCQKLGPVQASKKLGLTVESTLRIMSSLPVRRGTVALLRQVLQNMSLHSELEENRE